MRPLHSLLVALGLILACGLGWLLIRSSTNGVEVASAAPEAPAASATQASAEPVSLVPAGVAAPGPGPERTARETAVEPPSQVSDADASVRSGRSRVLGRVVDENGQPVADARVYAASGSGGMGLFGGIPLDARAAGEWSWLRRVETSTGPDGRFELAGLRPGSLRLAVRQAGFAPHDEDDRGLPAEDQVDLGDIRLEPGSRVSGRVVDARGNPVDAAEVVRLANPSHVESHGGLGAGMGSPVATTDADGGFVVDELAPGPWALRIESQLHPHALVSGETRSAGDKVEGLVVTLEEGDEIHGSVRDMPAGEPLSVRALPRGAGSQDVAVGGLTPSGPAEVRQADVAADGTFRLLGLRQGHSYELGLTRKGKRGPFGFAWSPALATPVRARAGERGVVLVYQPESALVFQALDAITGEPIEQFQVEAGIDWAVPQVGEDGRPVTARPEGRARVGNLRPRSSSDKARLHIGAVGYAPYDDEGLPLVVGQDTDLGPIFLEPLPLLSVRVLDDATGAPVEGADVTLSEVEPQRAGSFGRRIEIDIEASDLGDSDGLLLPGDKRQHARTDAEGIARVTIPIGASCRLSVRHEDHARWRSEVFPAPNAAAEREVRLGQGGQVTVRLLDSEGEPLAGGRVEHQAPAADGGFADLAFGGRKQVTNAEGEVVFEHLEPGTHRFRQAKEGGGGIFTGGGEVMAVRMAGMSGQDRGWVETLVAEGSTGELELVAPLLVAVEGRVREAGEPLAGASLQLVQSGAGGDGLEHIMTMGSRGPRAETDGQGDYRMEGVEPGEYTLVVRHPSRAMATELEVLVRESGLRQDVDLSVAIVEGRVTDEEGEPLAGVRVWPERAQPQRQQTMVRVVAFASDDGGGSMISLNEGGFARVQARTDADGRYQLRGVAPDVDLQVHAEGKGVQPGRSEELRLAHDEVLRGVDLVLATAGKIEVSAVRTDGSPARNLLLELVLEEGPEEALGDRHTEFVGEEGSTVVDGLVPGTWRLSLRTLGPDESEDIPEQTVVVTAGETAQVTFTVP